jgi:hypothetical protein
MKAFISESGAGSRLVAEKFDTILPLMIRGLDTFLAKTGIRKGALWPAELMRMLDKCEIGIFCATAEALSSDWFNFEGGAILNAARNSKRLVHAYVISGAVPPNSPFAYFQLTQANEQETFALFAQLNAATKKGVTTDQLRVLFSKFWPDLKVAIGAARRLSRGNTNASVRARP